MGRRTRDLVLLAVLFLAEPLDGVLQGDAGAAARTRGVPIDRHLVAGDHAAPMTLVDHVVDGEPAGLLAGALQRLAGIRVENEWNDPRLKVIPALVTGEVHTVVLRKCLSLLDS